MLKTILRVLAGLAFSLACTTCQKTKGRVGGFPAYADPATAVMPYEALPEPVAGKDARQEKSSSREVLHASIA